MSLGTRDRGRSSLLGEASSQGSRTYDVEAVTEEENDRGIDAIADRIGLLKKITKDIHTEAETQNRVLDRLGSSMDGARGTLSGTMNKFKRVFLSEKGHRLFPIVCVIVLLLLIAYYALFGR